MAAIQKGTSMPGTGEQEQRTKNQFRSALRQSLDLQEQFHFAHVLYRHVYSV
jgi:hypothetical protein